jgi:OmpA-OmpF porin, OOP family
MSASMITALQGLVTPGLIKTVSATLGESESAVTSGLEGIVSKILAALTSGATSPPMMNMVANLVANQAKDPNALGDIAGLLTGSNLSSVASTGGSQLIGSLFGVKESGVAQAAAAAAGLKPKSGAALMSLAGPLVLGALGKAPGAANMTASALPALLSGTWPTVSSVTSNVTAAATTATVAAATAATAAAKATVTQAAAPIVATVAPVVAAVTKPATPTITPAPTITPVAPSVAATAAPAAATVKAATTTTAAPTVTAAAAPAAVKTTAAAATTTAANVAKHVAKEEHRGGGAWWLWPVSLALIGGLTWAIWNMQMKTVKDLPAVKVEAPAPVVAEKKVEAPAPAPAAAPEPAPAPKVEAAPAPTPAPAAAPTAVAGADGMMRMALPAGPEISYAADGLEGKLISFLTDPAKVVDKNIWYDFDRLQFETGSTNLTAESKTQVSNVVEIMKAFPASVLKIGGYTDNVGDPASNLKLSDDRAKVVAASIVSAGINAARVEAEGYGEQYPIAENSTAEGRAKNRRTALSVRGK